MFRRKSSSSSTGPASPPKPSTLSRLASAANPYAKLRSHSPSIDLTPTQLDTLFTYQSSLPSFALLGEKAFLFAGVAENERHSRKLHQSLVSIGVIGSQSNTGNEDGEALNLVLIDRNFPHKLTYLTSFRLKKLVNMLFSWEQEIIRWRLLEEEERELRGVLRQVEKREERNEEQEALKREFRTALEGVKIRRKQWPSQREEGGARREQAPPAYYA